MGLMRDIDLNLLNSLQRLLANGSVTKAAEDQGISQSAMSYNLGRLRKTMGDELFTRDAGGLVMTPYARTLIEPLSRIMTEIDRLVSRSAAFDPHSAERTFTIALPDAAEVLIIPEILQRIGETAPGIRLELKNVDEVDVLRELDAGTIDMAVGVFSEGQVHHKRKLLHTDDYLCIYNGELLEFSNPIGLDEYLSARHLVLSSKAAGHDAVGEQLAMREAKRRITMTTRHVLSIPFIVLATPVVATIHGGLARYFVRQLGLRASPPPFEMPSVPISLLWHGSNDADPAHEWMRHMIQTSLTAARDAGGIPKVHASSLS